MLTKDIAAVYAVLAIVIDKIKPSQFSELKIELHGQFGMQGFALSRSDRMVVIGCFENSRLIYVETGKPEAFRDPRREGIHIGGVEAGEYILAADRTIEFLFS